MAPHDHLAILPIVLPLAAGAVTLVVDERAPGAQGGDRRRHRARACRGRHRVGRTSADASAVTVYRVGNWPAPFGIVLVVDRLSAVMVLLAAVLGVVVARVLARTLAARGPTLPRARAVPADGRERRVPHRRPVQPVRVLRSAAHGIVWPGACTAPARPRVRAGLHYITVNLAASLLFLIGVSLIYGGAGTLNMADLARHWREGAIGDRVLYRDRRRASSASRSSSRPACGRSASGCPARTPPRAPRRGALFAVLSKVGVYADPAHRHAVPRRRRGGVAVAGHAVARRGRHGHARIRRARRARLAGPCRGLRATACSCRPARCSPRSPSATPALTGAALYYLVVSTLALSAFFLLVELVERGRRPGADVLAVTAEAFGSGDDEEDESTSARRSRRRPRFSV